jgi:hypothetical protein
MIFKIFWKKISNQLNKTKHNYIYCVFKGCKVKKVKLSLCLTNYYNMKAYVGVDVQIYIFLTSALDGGESSASRPGRFTPGEIAPGTHWIGSWVDPRTGLEDVEKNLKDVLVEK